MEFRWVTLIALWTLLSGPVFDSPATKRLLQDAAQTAQHAPAQSNAKATPAPQR